MKKMDIHPGIQSDWHPGHRHLVLILLLLGLFYGIPAFAAGAPSSLPLSGTQSGGSVQLTQQSTYVCPMHPEEVSDQPGRCSQCGMFLVAQQTPNETVSDTHSHETTSYVCPMHPEEVSNQPGRCSQCGMFLVAQQTPNESVSDTHTHETTSYVCPMHPEEVSDQPGRCSQCGMFLVAQQTPNESVSETHSHETTTYVCPMHPDEVSDQPGKCSQCGMFLVTRADTDPEQQHNGHTHAKPTMQHQMPAGKDIPEHGMDMQTDKMVPRYWETSPAKTPNLPGGHEPALKSLTHAKSPLGVPMDRSQSHQGAASHQPESHDHAQSASYICPMHPQIVSQDEDASCPICGMDLVLKQLGSGTESQPHGMQGETTYICPMHPQIMQHEPGSCPICGMDLVARESVAPAGDHPQVYLSSAVIQNMGVRTTTVVRRTLGKTLHTQGMVTADDDRILYIHPKAGGWVKNLYLLTEGDRVERKDELIDFYSPWINQAQLDFIEALEEYDMVSFDPSRKTELGAKVDAARNALRLLGVSPMDLMRVENSRSVLNTIQLMAPQGGLVTELNVREGTYIEPYQRMLTIIDLSEVWIMVDIYEHQAPWVRQGDRVSITAPAIPGRKWNGKVDFIYPEVNPKTRTLRARIEVTNQDDALLLNMFVQVELNTDATRKEVLSIPREAVIITGERELVVLSQGNGHFQPVEVTTGVWSDHQVEILSGLSEGDEIVVSGQFLIDSESSLQASFLRMTQ